MTQKMPTRSSTPIRKRDWGTTPVLFSLKNVQPMLVSGPARPEGNVAAPSSFSDATPAVVATGASSFGAEGNETRIKPQAVLPKSFSYQNWIASALVVLLILFVISISVSTESKKTGVASKEPGVSTKETAAEQNPAVPALTMDSPAPSASGMNSTPLLVPDVVPPATSAFPSLELANNPSPAAMTPEVAIPSPLAPASIANTSAEPASQTPFASNAQSNTMAAPSPLGATLFAAAPASIGVSNNAIPATMDAAAVPPASPFPSTMGTQGMNFEAGKPQLQIGPATPANSMTSNPGVPANHDVAVNIQQTLTPDQPLAAFKELYNEAKRFDGESYGNASYGNSAFGNSTFGSVPATPVSTGASPNAYQPVYGASPNGTAAMPTQTIGGQQSGTQLSGQAYPPVQQEYKPISVQDLNAASNRYPPIRQPSNQVAPANGSGNAYTAIGVGGATAPAQTPYVPVGTPAYSAGN